MNNFIDKIQKIEKVLQEVEDLRAIIRIMLSKNEDTNDIGERLEVIVNNYLGDLKDIVNFIKENKDDFIEIYNKKYIEKEDSDNLIDEETEAKLDKIFENEELTDYFFNVALPKNLMEDFNISREEYDEILQSANLKAEKEIAIEEILNKIIEKEEIKNNESINCSVSSFSEQLNSPENGPQNR